MSTYLELATVFLLCIFIYPLSDMNQSSLIITLVAFILTCFVTSLKNNSLRVCLILVSFFVCIFIPDFAFFLPAILYSVCQRKQYAFCTAGIIIALYFKHGTAYEISMLTFSFLLSYYLAIRDRQREQLKDTIINQRDNSVEQEMILKRKNEQLLASQNDEIFVATLKERNRIAREIHDNVGHTLSRSILQVGALLAICRDEMLKPHLIQLKDSLDDAMNNIRNSVHDLHDESIDLRASLQSLVDGFTFCKISFNCDISKNVPKDIKYCFIAITKEALNNIIKHSNATAVNVTVKEHPGLYQLLIEDNGTITFSENTGGGIGLSNMRDRAEALNGIIRITSKNGVKIFVTIPKNQEGND